MPAAAPAHDIQLWCLAGCGGELWHNLFSLALVPCCKGSAEQYVGSIRMGAIRCPAAFASSDMEPIWGNGCEARFTLLCLIASLLAVAYTLPHDTHTKKDAHGQSILVVRESVANLCNNGTQVCAALLAPQLASL